MIARKRALRESSPTNPSVSLIFWAVIFVPEKEAI